VQGASGLVTRDCSTIHLPTASTYTPVDLLNSNRGSVQPPFGCSRGRGRRPMHLTCAVPCETRERVKCPTLLYVTSHCFGCALPFSVYKTVQTWAERRGMLLGLLPEREPTCNSSLRPSSCAEPGVRVSRARAGRRRGARIRRALSVVAGRGGCWIQSLRPSRRSATVWSGNGCRNDHTGFRWRRLLRHRRFADEHDELLRGDLLRQLRHREPVVERALGDDERRGNSNADAAIESQPDCHRGAARHAHRHAGELDKFGAGGSLLLRRWRRQHRPRQLRRRQRRHPGGARDLDHRGQVWRQRIGVCGHHWELCQHPLVGIVAGSRRHYLRSLGLSHHPRRPAAPHSGQGNERALHRHGVEPLWHRLGRHQQTVDGALRQCHQCVV